MKKFLQIITAYFMLVSTVTFSMFIMEEAIQMCVFGTWPAQDAGAWVLVKQNLEKMEQINNTMDNINKYCGWLQPFAYISYDAYAEATRAYITSVRQKILTVKPGVMINELVTVTFTPGASGAEIARDGTKIYTLGALKVVDCRADGARRAPENSKPAPKRHASLPSSISSTITTTGHIRESSNGQCLLTCD